MIKLLFLGSGSAFTVGANNYQSNLLLINEQDKKLLIDCGSDLRFSLYDAGFSHLDITDIYISHLHSDHAGGLEYIGFCTKFDSRCQQPNLYISKDLASDLWHKTLSGGMSSVSGDVTDLSSFFQVKAIPKNHSFVWSGINFDLIKVIHVDNGYYIMPSYGLFFTIEGQKIFLTTDIQYCWESHQAYYEQADLIYQDCEISPYPTTVHARYEQLIELPEHIKRKMWLYGYQPGNLPDPQKDGFLGFVKCGQTFTFGS
jgi:ribonuclease BN (tRNA processing enzyme)